MISNRVRERRGERKKVLRLCDVSLFSSAVVYLVGALEVGLAYFPFFACLSTPFRAAGAILGIFYSLSW